MIGVRYKNFIYVPIPKNGSSTFISFLTSHGWEEVEYLDFSDDLSQYKLWGHITDPNTRHTRGIEQFLRFNNRTNAIHDPLIQKLCAGSAFDVHSCGIWMLTRTISKYPIHWIPLDAKITKWNQYPTPIEVLNGNDLTNDFFRENNLDLFITDNDIKHVTPTIEKSDGLRDMIDQIKQKHVDENLHLTKWYLEPDNVLYNNTLKYYRDKYLNDPNL